MLNINPWTKIWTSPKETIQAIIAHRPSYQLGLMCMIYGFVWCLSSAQSFYLGDVYSLLAIVIGSLLLAAPIGYVILSLTAGFFWIAGRLFKGTAPFQHIRAAVAWSNVPVAVTLLIWLVLIGLQGNDLFAFPAALSGQFSIVDILATIQSAMGVWSVVILVGMIAQVQRFSNWKAFASLVIMACIWSAILFGIVYLMMLFPSVLNLINSNLRIG